MYINDYKCRNVNLHGPFGNSKLRLTKHTGRPVLQGSTAGLGSALGVLPAGCQFCRAPVGLGNRKVQIVFHSLPPSSNLSSIVFRGSSFQGCEVFSFRTRRSNLPKDPKSLLGSVSRRLCRTGLASLGGSRVTKQSSKIPVFQLSERRLQDFNFDLIMSHTSRVLGFSGSRLSKFPGFRPQNIW